MNVTQLLNELAQQNIRLAADGDRLNVRAPRGALTPWLRDRLTEHKSAILDLLQGSGSSGDLVVPQVQPDLAHRHDPFPLTDIQQAYWVGRMSEFDQGDVSIHFYVEIDGDALDLPGLEAAWNRMVARHDMLRSIVQADGTQRILEHVPAYSFVIADLRERAPEDVAAALTATREALSHQVLANDRWPAFEIHASRLAGGRTRLHLSVDLVNMDGGSLMLLLDEWTRTYFDPDTRLEPLELSYRDYVLGELSLRGARSYQDALAYWKQRVPALPAAPELPLAPAGVGPRRTRFVHKTATLERAAWERLKARAADRDLTVSAVLAAAYAEVLATWGRGPDFTINVTLFNRLPVHKQVDRILGDFTSMILLGVEGSAHTDFEARARAIQGQLWRDLEHHEVSGIEVLRELARVRQRYDGAIMPVVFTNMLNLSAKGLSPLYTALERLGRVEHILTQTPQVWLDYQVHEDAEGLRLTWDAVEALFPAGMVEDMLAAHCQLLRRLADDETPWRDPALLLTPPAQLAQRAVVNATEVAVPDILLHELFAAQVSQRPTQPAVITSERSIGYAELHRRACQVAHHLRDLGAGAPNTLVAIVMEKGWEPVAAALAIQMAGAAYLPIDPATPTERLQALLAHGEVKVVLTQSRLDARISWPADVTRIAVDGGDLEHADSSPLTTVQRGSDLAYVIYTSGSTGFPKGVMIEQRSVVNRMLDVNQRAAIGPGDRCLALTALHHDLSVYDIFGVLAAGGTIVVPDAAKLREPAHWAALMRREGVTVWNSVPAFLEMLVEHLEHAPTDELPRALRFVILAGDWIPVSLPDRLRRLLGPVETIASGGPTETTIWDIWYPVGDVDPSWRSIPYGRPLSNARYHVLDAALQPCPVWVPGQLCIAGAGLARGYWRDEERTRAAFIIHPQTGERLYRSGDLGRYLPDGTIEFLGRADNQVKIGGVRIELEEIEAALAQHPAVQACAVVVRGEAPGERRLAAFVVPASQLPTHDAPGEQPSLATTTSSPPASPPAAPQGFDAALADAAARLEFKARHLELRADLADRPALALPSSPADASYARTLASRRSVRTCAAQPLARTAIAGWLSALQACERDGWTGRHYPSAGSLYPVQVYLHIKPDRVEGVAGGFYYYHPNEHRLVELAGDLHIDPEIHAEVNRGAFAAAAFSLYLVAELRAIEPLYGAQAREFCLLEAGAITQLLMLGAGHHGVAVCPIGGLDFAPLRAALALSDSQILLHSLVGGAAPADDTGAPALTLAGLQAFLRTKLPEAMVPASYTVLDALPRTANGKVDRRALATRESALTTSPAPVAAGLEETITEIVRDVLQLERIGAEHNFFELGATSVHLVRIAGRLRTTLGRDVAVTLLFRAPTVRALAGQLAEADATAETEDQRRGQTRADARKAARGRRRGEGGNSDV